VDDDDVWIKAQCADATNIIELCQKSITDQGCERLSETLRPDSAEIREILLGLAAQWRKLAENEKADAKALSPSGLAWFQTG
jgi:hypothetical protein